MRIPLHETNGRKKPFSKANGGPGSCEGLRGFETGPGDPSAASPTENGPSPDMAGVKTSADLRDSGGSARAPPGGQADAAAGRLSPGSSLRRTMMHPERQKMRQRKRKSVSLTKPHRKSQRGAEGWLKEERFSQNVQSANQNHVSSPNRHELLRRTWKDTQDPRTTTTEGNALG